MSSSPRPSVGKLYADRDPRKLEPYYCRHIAAMTHSLIVALKEKP